MILLITLLLVVQIAFTLTLTYTGTPDLAENISSATYTVTATDDGSRFSVSGTAQI